MTARKTEKQDWDVTNDYQWVKLRKRKTVFVCKTHNVRDRFFRIWRVMRGRRAHEAMVSSMTECHGLSMVDNSHGESSACNFGMWMDSMTLGFLKKNV